MTRLARGAGVALAVVVLTTCVLADGDGGGAAPGWWRVLGRMHPVVVHFPIALILSAGLFEVWNLARRGPSPSATAVACLRLGVVSALVAALFGWIHAENEPHGVGVQEAISWHRWTGVGALVLAAAAALAAAASNWAGGRRAYRGLLALAIAAVTFTGHLGGELVYGEGYLLEPLRGAATQSTPAPEESAYARVAAPILDAHCVRCHGPEKQKGKLRLDSRAELFAKDRPEWLVVAGKPDASELIRRVTLPPDDFDVMPPEGELLTAEQVEALRGWIADGAR